MSQAITDLMNDHAAILTALDIFAKLLDHLKINPTPDVVELAGFVDFLKEFADKCHHGKEEGLLFPAMVAVGVPDRGGPIGVMMAEHIQGRGYIHEMTESLEEPLDFAKFETAGRDYIHLLSIHIQKEDTILFPMADRMLKPSSLAKLHTQFAEHEEKVIGNGRHELLHAQLERLRMKYSA